MNLLMVQSGIGTNIIFTQILLKLSKLRFITDSCLLFSDPKQKLQAALDCRSLLHASLTSLEAAQLALPHVELKYMSHRQVLAVNHCNTYLITDIANAAR